MSKEIIINSDQTQTRIAIVENGRLAELFIETKEIERTIGNLFLGRVRRIMPSIQAAFVDIGQKQDAFLHFSDLVDNIPDWLKFIQQKNPRVDSFKAEFAHQPIKGRRRGSKESGAQDKADGENSDYDVERIDGDKSSSSKSVRTESINPVNYLKRDSPILVRISKEPIASKGSRITTDISLAGRFLVLVPLAGYVAVSKKIVSYKERRRLKALAKSLVPKGFGVIVRTVAEGHNAKSLDTDLRLLIQKWEKVEETLAEGPEIPFEIHEDVNMASSIIRDFFSEDFDRIVIDNERLYRNIKGYVQAVAPKMASSVQVHKGKQPLFQAMKIEKAVEQAFSSRVDMPSGGYLFIEQTEAMHVVDVNSGRAGRGLSQEESSVRVNLEAATLIAEQVRLRDLGGILVVDFIDMRQAKNRRKVFDHLRREFRKDRAVTKVLQMSDFGLIQITRQRLRPSITHSFSMGESNAGSSDNRSKLNVSVERPSHETVEPSDLVRKIDDWLDGFKESGKRGPVRLIVHPFTAAYLNRKIPGQSIRWFMKHRIRVRIEADAHVDPLSFRFVDVSTGKHVSSRPAKPDVEREPDKKTTRAKSSGRSGRSRSRGESRDGIATPSKQSKKSDQRRNSRKTASKGRDSRSSDSRSSDSRRGKPRPNGSKRGGSQGGSRRSDSSKTDQPSEREQSDRTEHFSGGESGGRNGDGGRAQLPESSSNQADIPEKVVPNDASTQKESKETNQSESKAAVVLKADAEEAKTPGPEPVSTRPRGHVYNIDLRTNK